MDSAVENQQDQSVDNNLITVDHIFLSTLKREGIEWFGEGDNMEYLSNVFVKTSSRQIDDFKAASIAMHRAAIGAARFIAEKNLWEEAGIPHNAIPLVEYSLQNELGDFLVGRFDFAGGYDGVPLKFLEYNADTCSLMPETAIIQELHYLQEQKKLKGEPFHNLMAGLTQKLSLIRQRNEDKEPFLLVSTLGYIEDRLNVEIIMKAAKDAGFEEVRFAPLEEVIFSEEEGIFMEEEGEYHRFDFWYKFIPWEFIADEEPELMRLLTEICTKNLAVVMNPALTMLMQCKSIAKYMYDLDPSNPLLLKTTFDKDEFRNGKYVQKPIFGRMGENIAYYDGNAAPAERTDGDYGDYRPIYQEIAEFNIDSEEHRYQPSMYFTHFPCGLAIRRQDDLIIDDDAEFVGNTVV